MANSKRKCRFCKKFRLVKEGIDINGGFYCDQEHAIAYANKTVLKEKADNKVWSDSLPKNTLELNKRDLTWQENQTQPAFNRMRVQQELLWFYDRGIEPYCISCQKTKMDFCCGHNKTRGSNSYLQFDERNTFLQCNRACNESLSGNINGNSHSIGYMEGLKLRFGSEEGQSIISYCNESPSEAKRTVEEFEALRKIFNQTSRALKPKVENAKFLFEQLTRQQHG